MVASLHNAELHGVLFSPLVCHFVVAYEVTGDTPPRLNTFQPQFVCSFLHNGSTLYIGYAEMHRLHVATPSIVNATEYIWTIADV
jgi:hypothetical protein